MSDTAVIDEPTISDRHDEVLTKLGLEDFDVSNVESDFTENAVQDEPPVAQEDEPSTQANEEPEESEVKEKSSSDKNSPTNDAWAKQRIKFTEMEAELADLKKADTPEESAKEAPSQNEVQQATASDVMVALVKAKLGELDDGVDSEMVTRLAEEAISLDLSSSELTSVLAEARKGQLGENSDLIAAEVQQAILIAQDRERSDVIGEETSSREHQEELNQLNENRIAELKTIETHMPEFVNPDSPEFKAIPEWMERNIGTFDADGKIAKAGIMSPSVAQYMIAHPIEICKQVAQEVSRSSVKQTQQQSRIAAQRRAIALGDSPVSATPGVQPNQSGKTPNEEAREKLFELGRSSGSMKSDRLV
tara:strand:- start:4249 stop:5337 length:1089 start_codon:yes stop_codon:yes gene_type:complete